MNHSKQTTKEQTQQWDQSIIYHNKYLRRTIIISLFKDFYRVPNYQREYVWGEKDKRGNGGEEVDQYLNDIFSEFENATKESAPEYFIGTIVVCKNEDGVFQCTHVVRRWTTAQLYL